MHKSKKCALKHFDTWNLQSKNFIAESSTEIKLSHSGVFLEECQNDLVTSAKD